jgi:hypothetical protein
MEALGTARLSDGIAADRAVTATISRGEIDDVLRQADGTPELVLRLADEGGAEQGRISMTWSRDDLERLLAAATADGVVLTFDRDELAAAFGDVEAHGLRARAAIFAVAAAGALGSGVGAAYAQIPASGDDAAATPTALSEASHGAGSAQAAALAARSQALNEQYGLGASGADAALAARSQALNEEYGLGAGSAADAAAALGDRSQALNEQYGLGASGADAALAARSQALNEQYGLQPGGTNDPAVRALEARGTAMNEAYGLGTAGTDAMVTDASTGSGYTAAPTGSSGTFDIQRPADEAALLVGGVLLTLAGAAFAVRRTASPRPA